MFDELQRRCVAILGRHPASAENLTALEALLQVHLPADFRRIAEFYCGGVLGEMVMNSFTPAGPGANIGESTLRFRRSAGLPGPMIVLSDAFSESLVVLDTDPTPFRPSVYWCDHEDLVRLATPNELRSPTTWNSYADFFSTMLRADEDEMMQSGAE